MKHGERTQGGFWAEFDRTAEPNGPEPDLPRDRVNDLVRAMSGSLRCSNKIRSWSCPVTNLQANKSGALALLVGNSNATPASENGNWTIYR